MFAAVMWSELCRFRATALSLAHSQMVPTRKVSLQGVSRRVERQEVNRAGVLEISSIE